MNNILKIYNLKCENLYKQLKILKKNSIFAQELKV